MTSYVQLLKDESGATAIEYGLIAVAAITALTSIGGNLKRRSPTLEAT